MTPNLKERIARLSPEKRALFSQRLQQDLAQGASTLNISPRDTNKPAQLSFSQQRLWFLQQLEPSSNAYNETNVWRLTGVLNTSALTRALVEIVRRHEVLRTTFTLHQGDPVQVILPADTIVVREMTLAAENAHDLETKLQAQIHTIAQQPFNLEKEPPCRYGLIKLGEHEHVLVCVNHHISSDGWSSGVFYRELSVLYNAFAAGQPSSLLELPIQYADFAAWQRQTLQGEKFAAHLNYWQIHLANMPETLNLPHDFARSTQQNTPVAVHSFTLDATLVTGLWVLSRQANTTLYMTLLAAFQVLLMRYSNQTDIAVGSPIANRQSPELEKMLGMFVNTLVMRSDLSGNPTFRTLLGRVRQVALDAYEHQDMPFEKLVEVLNPVRQLNYNPLFQVMLVLQNAPRTSIQLEGLQMTRIKPAPESAKFDLSLFLTETGSHIEGRLEYDSALFKPETAAQLIRHFVQLLQAVVANPDCPIEQIALLAEDEQKQLLVLNPPANSILPNHCIHQVFEAQVDRTPNAVALLQREMSNSTLSQVTLNELNEKANQLAHYLITQGVQTGDFVGICFDRTPLTIVTLLAVLKAGAIYLPLDAKHPYERLAFMLNDVNAKVILTEQATQAVFQHFQYHQICLDHDWHIIAKQPSTNPNQVLNSEAGAYIIYTSGSTGQPKGVVGSHKSTLNRFEWMWQTYPFVDGECCCHKTVLSFVDSIWEIFGPLLRGVPLLLIPEVVVQDPAQFIERLAQSAVSRIVLVPSLLDQLLQYEPHLRDKLPHLKIWSCSGEALSHETLLRFHNAMPGRVLLNLYGSSEVAADVTCCQTSADDLIAYIGSPIMNNQAYVLDGHLQLVPMGVMGELYIGGVQVANGYHHRPDLTASKFIADPFGSGQLFRTGDLARWHHNGSLEFLGRNDFQIKIRGYRIELSEIESALRTLPFVQDCVVVTRGDQPDTKQLHAYVALNQVQAVTPEALRLALQDKLPSYMIPAAFVMLDALPLTPNGKVNRLALPAPKRADLASQNQYTPARNAYEQKLVTIWEAVIGHRPIGIHDNFFDLGGNSMMAVRLFAQMQAIVGQNLPLVTLFQYPTIAQLSDQLQQAGWKPTWGAVVALQPNGTKPPLFCVPPAASTPLRLSRILSQLGPDQPIYGLQYAGMEDDEEPQHTIEDIAAYFVKHIQALFPTGPYMLVGACFGGEVAYEMAQQLQQQEVILLCMLDSGAPHNGPTWDVYSAYDQVWDPILANWLSHLSEKHQRVLTIQMREASRDYRAKPYFGKLMVIQSQEFTSHGMYHWHELAAGELIYAVIPNSDHHMFFQNEVFAKQVVQYLTHHINETLYQRATNQIIEASPLLLHRSYGVHRLIEDLKQANNANAEMLRQANNANAELLKQANNANVEMLKQKLSLETETQFTKWRIASPIVKLLRKLYHQRMRGVVKSDCEQLIALKLLDEAAYLNAYPEIRRSKLSAAEHFIYYGWHEERQVGVYFDAKGYLLKHPDVLASGVNPVLHYVRFGHRENRER